MAEGLGTLAVVCVVDSSLTLATEWSRVLAEYVSPLLKRLSEVYPDYQIRLGFITYATAVTRPTPLLVRRFFSPLQSFTKELGDAVTNLEMGRTGDGGGYGMAMLEGLVAAVEMFDDLQSCLLKGVGQPSPAVETLLANSPICHIFHVAASPPDDSQCPLWNRNSLFDNVTWETLPMELKKRDIYLSLISLREFNQLSELHLSLAMESQQPWFNVRTPHRILLSGFATQQRVIKRPIEKSNSERAPDSKRIRAQQLPSKIAPAIPNSGFPPTSVSATNAATPSINPSSQQSMHQQKPPSGPQTFPQNVFERLRVGEIQLQRLEEQIKSAAAMGNVHAAEVLKTERDKQRAMFAKVKAAVASYAQSHARSLALAPQDAGIGSASVDHQRHLGIDNVIQARDAQLPTNRTASSTFATPPNANQDSASALQLSPSISKQMVPQVRSSEQQSNRQTALQVGGTSPAPEPPPDKVVWQGVLAWSGSDATTQGRKEVHCQVHAILQSGTEAHSETWPPTLMLIPSREPAVSAQDLQSWIIRFKPVLCAFRPHARSSDPKINESHYRSLIQLLIAKKMYAIAAWSLPSGGHENRVLVFPANPRGLAGAFYPLTGIPEYPKPSGGNLNRHAALTAHWQKLPPEQRQQVQMMIRQRQLQQRQQQQQAARLANSTQPLNVASQPPVSAANALQPTTGTTIQSGISGSMTDEIMQSFMQRSVEGGDTG